MPVNTKRIYEDASLGDGYRVLVDRLWPRGKKKEEAGIDLWLKEVAPSTALRKWFNHDPERWTEFVKKYKEELQNSEALDELKAIARKHKTLTLLYGAKDEEHNQAVALQHMIARSGKSS